MRRRWAALLVLTACGQAAPESAPNLAPLASAGPDRQATLGDPVPFDGSFSIDTDGQVVSYRWTFGDGSAADGEVVSHAYAAPGRYLVQLTVTDDGDETGRDEATVEVAEARVVPRAGLPASPRALAALVFDAAASTAPAAIASYQWRFGDGAEGEGAQVSHTYARAGSYRVRLTVADAEGRTGVFTKTLEVGPADVAGVYDLVVAPARYDCGPYDATFAEAALTVTVDGSGNVTATSGSGKSFTGTLDGAALSLSGSYLASTGGSCPRAPVQAAVTATFQGAGQFTGRVGAYYDLAVGCQCSAGFDVTGSRR